MCEIKACLYLILSLQYFCLDRIRLSISITNLCTTNPEAKSMHIIARQRKYQKIVDRVLEYAHGFFTCNLTLSLKLDMSYCAYNYSITSDLL